MIGIGFLVGIGLIFTGIGQAIARDWTIDGLFLLLCGVGLLILTLAFIAASETTAGGTSPPQGSRPDA